MLMKLKTPGMHLIPEQSGQRGRPSEVKSVEQAVNRLGLHMGGVMTTQHKGGDDVG